MLRLILSILTGLLTTAVLATATDHGFHLTGIYPPYGQPNYDTGLLLLASAYRIVFQVGGAYLAAMVARENAMKAVWILGIIGAILWIAGTIAMSDMGPVWYGILGAALSIPTTLLGGKLYQIRASRSIQS